MIAECSDPGFRVIPGVLSPVDLEPVTKWLDSLPQRRGSGGVRRVLGAPAVAALALDDRVTALAREFVGANATPFRATLFDKSPHANWLVAWHQDAVLPLERRVESPEWGPWTVKGSTLHAAAPGWALEQVVAIRIHLDDSRGDNGSLRVLPNTHCSGVLGPEAIAHAASSIPAVECTVPRGGVVVMRPLTLHASSKSRNDAARRVLHVEYAATLRLAPDIHISVDPQRNALVIDDDPRDTLG